MNAPLIELASLATAILLPSLVLRYLRPVLQGVLADLCPSPRAQEFWWRVVHVLGVSGSLLLVMLFVSRPDDTHDLMSVMRQTLAFSAGGIFFSVAMVARRIDHAVKADAIEAAYQAQMASNQARRP